jgi:hypothetical protein
LAKVQERLRQELETLYVKRATSQESIRSIYAKPAEREVIHNKPYAK